ncbi:SETMR methyltransferase, partial [Pseudoatta argentina]
MSIQSPAKCEIRSVIRYLVWKGKTPVEVYNEVKTAYGDKGMNRTSVFKWCREFKNGRTSVHDDQRSERPSILTDDIVEKIENALRDDRRLTMDELSAMFPQISRSQETITETLGYRKLSARWVPKQLTDQHKLNRVEAGQEFLRRYKLHGDEFLRSIVTGDITDQETMAHHVIMSLDAKAIACFRDLIAESNENKPYTKLKQYIIEIFSASAESQLRQLIKGQVLTSGKPSQILSRLRNLNTDKRCDDARGILATSESTDLDKLAKMANKIAETASDSAQCAAKNKTPTNFKLYAANNTRIDTYGESFRTLLGVGINSVAIRLFTWNFCVTSILYPIEADLIAHYGLLLDLLIDPQNNVYVLDIIKSVSQLVISTVNPSTKFVSILSEFPEVTGLEQTTPNCSSDVRHHLRNSSQTFQRQIFRALGDLEFVFAVIDDILIASTSLEEHEAHLRIMLQRLKILYLQLNIEKKDRRKIVTDHKPLIYSFMQYEELQSIRESPEFPLAMKRQIPFTNIVALSCDNVSVMTGKHYRLKALFALGLLSLLSSNGRIFNFERRIRRLRRKNRSPAAILEKGKRRAICEEIPPAYRPPLRGVSKRLRDKRVVPKRMDRQGRITVPTIIEEDASGREIRCLAGLRKKEKGSGKGRLPKSAITCHSIALRCSGQLVLALKLRRQVVLAEMVWGFVMMVVLQVVGLSFGSSGLRGAYGSPCHCSSACACAENFGGFYLV